MNTNYGQTRDFIKALRKTTEFHLKNYNVKVQFPESVANLCENDLEVEPCENRKDFRSEKAFTIDCEDCKDMDDAVSVVRSGSGYRLAVHIADVSAYVKPGSELDQAASQRATSIYLPNLTIPMLPEVLSNNCCSLNPGVARNTLSVIMYVNRNGEVTKSEITKGIIRSRVKGIYSEINAIIANKATTEMLNKYDAVYDELQDMVELYKILRKKREQYGANIEDSNKPKIIIKKHNITLVPTREGIAENLIEEFMILANRIVADYLVDHDLPAIFRIQEAKNHLAAYSPLRYKHCELAIESYSHFTSPIRRLADLKVHQIISMHLNGYSNEEIHDAFDEMLPEICEVATKKSRTAKDMEQQCERYCYRNYFMIHSNDRYTGNVVCFDKCNRPVVQLDRYNIKVVGYTRDNWSIGDTVSFYVGVSDKNQKLMGKQIKRYSCITRN